MPCLDICNKFKQVFAYYSISEQANTAILYGKLIPRSAQMNNDIVTVHLVCERGNTHSSPI